MIWQSFKMAWKAIVSNKMRSFLTMLGIIIGVMALNVLVSLTNGATSSIMSSIDSLGNNLFMVSISDDKGNPIKYTELYDFIESDELAYAAPDASTSVTASGTTNTEKTVSVNGTNPDYQNIMSSEVEYGRFLSNPDLDNHSNVAVLNHDMAIKLFGRTDIVGETVKLSGVSYTVIGVLAEDKTAANYGFGENYTAYIPYTSLIRLTDSVSTSVTNFYVTATDENNMTLAEAVLTQKLNDRFDNDTDAYSVVNQSSIAETADSISNMMSMLMGGIAGISLLVGGIGIMNIMLVSVTERTREIGIRKAIGAGYWSIMLQFLIEALVVSILGCAVGIGLAVAAIKIVSNVTGTAYAVSKTVVWLSVAFSVAIGVIFGIYPANKAARKKPIEALRYTG